MQAVNIEGRAHRPRGNDARTRETGLEPTELAARERKRSDIEALRAVAILLVVAFHGGIPGISGGFIGVDVFFVLSGYLITGLLIGEIHRTGRLSLLQFYARRVRRLLPASSLVLVVTLVLASVVFAPQELDLAARGARASSLYLSNMFFAGIAADYFAPRVATNPVLHTWSLAVEEQFYLFWPLLIMLGLQVWRSTRGLAAILIGLTLASLGACVWLTLHQTEFAFYALPTRAWEFGIGGLAAMLPRGALRLSATLWLALGWLGAGMIIACALVLSSASAFPGWIALLPVIATACTLVAGAELPHRGVGRLFDLRPLQRIGTLSYSWYLWHWPFLVFAAALFPGLGKSGKLVAVVLALLLAHITYRYFENPIRSNSHLAKRPALSLALAAGVTLVCVAVATLDARFAGHLADTDRMRALTAAEADIAHMPRTKCVSLDYSAEVKVCSFGAPESSTNLVIFGDSHAIQWFDGLRNIAEMHGWKLTTFLKSGCAAADISPNRGEILDSQCSQWRDDALRRILTLRPSVVLLSSATNKLGRRSDPSRRAGPDDLEQVRQGTLRTLGILTEGGLRVAFLRDTPEFPFDVPTCLARSVRHTWYPRGSCDAPIEAVLDRSIFEVESSVLVGLPGVRLIDMTEQFCHHGTCRAEHDGVVIYRDADHLTGAAAARLAPVLEAEVMATLKQ